MPAAPQEQYAELIRCAEKYIRSPQQSKASAVMRWRGKAMRWLKTHVPETGLSIDFATTSPPAQLGYESGITRGSVLGVQKGLRILQTAGEMLPMLKTGSAQRLRPHALNNVFIVHGHEELMKISVARFIQQLQLQPIEVIDIFAAAGLKQPDISILSEQFLAEVRELPQKNLAVELLRKLLSGEIKLRARKYLIQSKSFAALLEVAIRKYQNRAIEAAAVIEELIKIAKDMREADQRGEASGLTPEERAFYDALADNESAVQAMGSKELRVIATELVTHVRNSVTIDWTLRESARAKIKVMVKRILRKHGYPPDLQEEAVKTVLAQAELLCADWVG